MKKLSYALTASLLLGTIVFMPTVSANEPCWVPDAVASDFPAPEQLVIPIAGQSGRFGTLIWFPNTASRPTDAGAYDFVGDCGLLECILRHGIGGECTISVPPRP